MSNTPTKSWRDVITIHPAADLFPMMSPDELKALGEDIKAKGITAPIVWWTEREADIGKTPPPKYQLLDGRNRLDAMEMVGIKLIDASSKPPAFYDWVWEDCRFGEGVPKTDALTGNITVERTNPYEYVLSANMHRRHLTAEQKREIVAKALKAQPEKSNRTIAKQTKTDDKTVAAVRGKLEATAEIPHLIKTVGTDGKARSTAPTRRARRTADTPHAEELVEPHQSDIERVFPDANQLVHKILSRDAIAPGYALAVALGVAAHLGDGYPELPTFLKRIAELTARAARG